MTRAEPMVFRGQARRVGGAAAPATVALGPDGLRLSAGDGPGFEAAYRDVATVALDGQTGLVTFGDGPAGEQWSLERFGSGLEALIRAIRDGRLRQWLTDGLVEIAADEPVELVETATGPVQLLYHDRGVALVPLDERQPRLRVRRADIGTVAGAPEAGRVTISGVEGRLAIGRPTRADEASRHPAVESTETIELIRLGAAATRHQQRWTALRDGAAADIAAIIGSLMPDAPFDVRRGVASVLREGRPADAASLGAGWATLEAAALVEPTFAESYQELIVRAGGSGATRWIAIAPETPGAPDRPRIWFLIGLPGNLVALELVSAGAHATYLFRAGPRATYAAGSGDPAPMTRAVGEISEALIDGRFLREPMALPEARLAEPAARRYRLALRALPSLAAARSRFVARLVHRDGGSWAAALDDLIAWHGMARDEAAEWPGRSAQEVAVDEARPAGSLTTD